MAEQKHVFGLDFVRILGMVLLLWLHFYMRNYYYYRRADSVGGIIATAFVPFFLSCVPLFMMLTGYLKCEKTWNMRYYASLLPILISWGLCSLIQLLYKILVLQENHSAGEWLKAFFDCRLSDYSWYVAMYFCIYLFSPMLNLIWKGCRDKRQHRMVLATMLVLAILPHIVNSSGYTLLPGYMNQLLWPCYYMIGAYIRTYQPRIKPVYAVPLMTLICLGLGLANVLTRTQADNYYTGFSIEYNSLCLMILVTCFFLLSYRIQCGIPAVKKAAEAVSSVVFEMYLLSWLFDTRIFIIGRGQYGFGRYPIMGLWMTGTVFILSFLAAWPVHWLSGWLTKGILRWFRGKNG